MPAVVAKAVARSRWQLSLKDLYVVAGLCAAGLFAVTTLYHDIFLRPWQARSLFLSFAVLLVTLVAAGAGFLRAYADAIHPRRPAGYMIAYVLMAWWLPPLFCWFWYAGVFLVIATFIPGCGWAIYRSRKEGFGDLAFEGRIACGVLVTWAFLATAWAVTFRPFRRCCSGESAGIAACKTYAEAQDIYRRTDWDGDGVLEYSATIKGANSLYEKTAGTGDLTLVDAAFANADGKPNAQPKAGYYFKILTAQGAQAPGGRKSYFNDKGDLILGYALLAWPAFYDGTGRHSFQINNTGTVYQMDMGPDTQAIAEQMTEYNPSTGWVVAE